MELPTYVQIEPVGQCNLRCRMCAIQFRRDGPPYGPPAFMAFDVFTRLVDQFAGMETLHLQGLGEPMMHPRFFDMVEFAVRRGVRVTVNSNMTLLNRARAERCVGSGLDTMHASLDGARAATFERIRARASFENVVGNIRLLMETRARLRAERPHLHLVMVLMRDNLDELPELVSLAASLGADELFAQHLCHDFAEGTLPGQYRPMREFVDEQTLLGEDPQRVADVFDDARATAEAAGLTLRLPRLSPRSHPPGTPGRERCDWPWRGAYVAFDGRAMPCCMVSTPDRVSFGSMAAEGVEPIWNGSEYQAFRARLGSDRPPDICASCSIYRGVF